MTFKATFTLGLRAVDQEEAEAIADRLQHILDCQNEHYWINESKVIPENNYQSCEQPPTYEDDFED